jgi:hypothetical protein
MRHHRQLLVILLALIACVPALATDGAWKFERDPRDHPMLTYAEGGKTVFFIGCGRAFGLHAKYPATPQKTGDATITLANSKSKMTLTGEFQEPGMDSVTTFLQWDLGYRRQNPDLYGPAWNRQKTALLDLLSAGPITLSAEGRSYEIPGASLPDWRQAFDECG